MVEISFADGRVELLSDAETLGVYERDARFEYLLERLSSAITRIHPSVEPELMRFPPVIARRTLERCGYLASFPHLLGTVHTFAGDARAHAALLQAAGADGNWGSHQTMTDLALTPAACYAVYPRIPASLPADGLLVDVESWCFRQEPTRAPERMRAFRMREFVRLGSPTMVQQWRAAWLMRADGFLAGLGLRPTLATASDPFFGAGAQFLSTSQREQELKFELSVEVYGTQTATVSCNYHLDHFGVAFGINTVDGEVAHTACVAFGMERLALALFTAHGPLIEAWPTEVLTALEPPHV